MKTNSVRKRLLSSTIISGVALAMAGTAIAQEAQTTGQYGAASAPGQAATEANQEGTLQIGAENSNVSAEGEIEDDTAVEGIVVTGSRIPMRDYTSTSPITTVTGETLSEMGGGTVESYINSLPQVAPHATRTQNNPSYGGSAFIDLRQLGAGRTLTLVDGRRLVPGSSDGSIDVSILPPAVIDRVEIITGGASAVYGTDAISGVVNFVLKKSFEGMQASAQFATSEHGDGEEFQADLLLGARSADGRGNVMFALSFNTREGISQTEREFTESVCYFDLNGCYLNPSPTTPDGTFAATAAQAAGLEAYFVARGIAPGVASSARRFGFNPDGSLFIAGTSSDAAGVVGYTGPYAPEGNYDPTDFYGFNFNVQNLLSTPFERYNFYTSAAYELNDKVEFYGNALFSTYTATNALASAPGAIAVPVATTASIDPTTRAALIAAGFAGASGTGNLNVSRRYVELGPRIYDYETTAFQLTGGLRGDFEGPAEGSIWRWDAFASHGRYNQQQTTSGAPSLFRVKTALAGCPAGATPPGAVGSSGSPAPCVQLDIFGAGAITPEQAEYIELKGVVDDLQINQTTAQANLSGEAFELPAGWVGFSVGAEYRNLDYYSLPAEPNQTGDFIGGNASGPVIGGFDVTELYGEVRVPILADLPFVDYLGVEAGYRFSDYSTGVQTHTWKYGGEYGPFEWLRFRSLVQRAVRAPGIGSLYATVAEGYPPLSPNGDPCDIDSTYRTGPDAAGVAALCQAQAPGVNMATYQQNSTQLRTFSGGNQELTPEVADTFTAGVVFRASSAWPTWLRPLSATVDYWKIEIAEVVSAIGAATSFTRCYSSEYNPSFDPNTSYCQNINRDPVSGEVGSYTEDGFVSQLAQNLAAYEASGVDFGFAYNLNLADYGLSPSWGTLSWTTLGTWYEMQRVQSLPGDPWSQNFVGYVFDGTPGGTTLPEYKISSRLGWNVGDLDLSLRWLYIHDVVDYYAVEGDIPGIDAYNYFYLNGQYQLTDTLQIFGGVDNLLAAEPPLYSSGFQYGTDPSTYDVIGRTFYVGARARF